MSNEETKDTPAPFGSVIAPHMASLRFSGGHWGGAQITPVEPLSLHPAAHVLHYGSSCFEGMKAFRSTDGPVRIFRIDRHLVRLQHSAELLCLPFPPLDIVENMIRRVVESNESVVPQPPGALYLRPVLIGTHEGIGGAGKPSPEALLYVLASPVGDYFSGGAHPLRILIEDQAMRTTPGFGQAKSGGNYAASLRHVKHARDRYGAEQVLFCPGGDVQETGASNFFLFDDRRVLTKPLSPAFLHGVTRDSILVLARELGYEVIERDFTVAELKDWIRTGEAALSGTAAVLSGVGSFIHDGAELTVGDGRIGPNTLRLRNALLAIQSGNAEDRFGWLS
ncbi:MAG: branched-chain amino acid aminotransferase [Gammaproteobacteria bacterium]|nr:branched-chain amino acid aminotransferase [Gammaproteobacteria bacterium]